MDLSRLQAAVAVAEKTGCEGTYLGFSLGQAMADFPEEVISGRVASGRRRTEAHRIAKAYTRLAAAAQELEEAVAADTGTAPPAAPVGTKRSLPPRNPAAGILACMPVAPTKIQGAKGSETAKVQPPQSPQNSMQKLSSFTSKFFLTVGWMKGLCGVLVAFVLPKLAVRLVATLMQICLQLMARQASTFVSTAAAETEQFGNQLIRLAEATLDVALLDAPVAESTIPPLPQIAASLAQTLEGGNISQAVAELLEMAQTQPVAPQPAWRLPGWMLMFVGFAVNKAF